MGYSEGKSEYMTATRHSGRGFHYSNVFRIWLTHGPWVSVTGTIVFHHQPVTGERVAIPVHCGWPRMRVDGMRWVLDVGGLG